MIHKRPLTFTDVLNEDLQDPEFRAEWIKVHQDPKTIADYAKENGLTYDEAKGFLQSLLEESLSGNCSPSEATRKAIEEGRRIADDPTIPGYKDIESLRSALEENEEN